MRDDEPRNFEFGPSHPATPVQATGSGGRVIAIILMVVILIAGGAYFYYYERDLAGKLLKDTPLELSPTVTTVYKWQDAEGNWQITDRRPTGGIAYEVLEYNSDTNVMPLVPRDKE